MTRRLTKNENSDCFGELIFTIYIVLLPKAYLVITNEENHKYYVACSSSVARILKWEGRAKNQFFFSTIDNQQFINYFIFKAIL